MKKLIALTIICTAISSAQAKGFDIKTCFSCSIDASTEIVKTRFKASKIQKKWCDSESSDRFKVKRLIPKLICGTGFIHITKDQLEERGKVDAAM